MAESNCKLCVYFVDIDRIGQCRRYPQFVTKHESEWCGEFWKEMPNVGLGLAVVKRQARKTLKLRKDDDVQAA
jgi:hypothetical protein